MSEQMLEKIDFLRERSDVTYEEAIALLERNEGDVARALVELERQGRVFGQKSAKASQGARPACEPQEAKEKATSFLKKACQTRVVVERNRADGEKDTIANLSAPFVVGVTVFAPYITLASAALTLVSGYQVRVRKEEEKTEAAGQ